jgi:hypothetical protein
MQHVHEGIQSRGLRPILPVNLQTRGRRCGRLAIVVGEVFHVTSTPIARATA